MSQLMKDFLRALPHMRAAEMTFAGTALLLLLMTCDNLFADKLLRPGGCPK